MLRDAGFGEQSWFAAYPDYKLPSCLVHEAMYEAGEGRALVKQLRPDPNDRGRRSPARYGGLHGGPAVGDRFGTRDGTGELIRGGLWVARKLGLERGCGRNPGWRSAARPRLAICEGAHARRAGLAAPTAGLVGPQHQLAVAIPALGCPGGRQELNSEDLLSTELANRGISVSSPQGPPRTVVGRGAGRDPVRERDVHAVRSSTEQLHRLDDAGRWHFVDPEFLWDEPLDPTMVALRSLAWTAQRVCRRMGSSRGSPRAPVSCPVAEALLPGGRDPHRASDEVHSPRLRVGATGQSGRGGGRGTRCRRETAVGGCAVRPSLGSCPHAAVPVTQTRG